MCNVLGSCAALWLMAEAAHAQPRAAAALGCIQRAYPEQVCGVEGSALVLCNGSRFAYDDGQTKTHAQRLANADLEDMLAQPYPSGTAATPPAKDVEPGRVRYTPLFDAMYGSSASAVKRQLTTVIWLPNSAATRVEITRINHVNERLEAVSRALERLPAPLRAAAAKLAGTFNYRTIAGTDQRSAHAYGIAIDVAPELGDYWRWREAGAAEVSRYRNRMPLEIVAAFEHEGFIWGGRWNHYDTMHFEYRPELLQSDCTRPAAQPATLTNTATPAPEQPARRAAPAPSSAPSSATNDTIYTWLKARAQAHLDERIPAPAGFARKPLAAGSFAAWLRHLPVRAGRGTVALFDGSVKRRQDLHAAVLDLDTGTRDLQQCADAVMRLRAEYLFATGRADDVCFRAASGDAMPYSAYRRGLRAAPGRAAPWQAAAAPDTSWSGFRKYLDGVFNFANTAALTRELAPQRRPSEIQAGDVYIEPARGTRYGHAVLVLDVTENAAGERAFLIAQSYMPAQDMHVLVNPTDAALSPWYRAPSDGSLETPEWDFPAASLRRFGASCAER